MKMYVIRGFSLNAKHASSLSYKSIVLQPETAVEIEEGKEGYIFNGFEISKASLDDPLKHGWVSFKAPAATTPEPVTKTAQPVTPQAAPKPQTVTKQPTVEAPIPASTPQPVPKAPISEADHQPKKESFASTEAKATTPLASAPETEKKGKK